MRSLIWVAALLACAATSLPALGAEATFERSLTVNDRPDLTVSTGAGTIHMTAGPAGQIHIFGRVRSGWGGESQVSEIAAHPPIEQTGNIVRIGAHRGDLRNVSIDYEIEAPAGAYLSASTGSGNLEIDGVGSEAKLNTGSGNIHATGLRGSFSVETGSGNIYATQIGDGDVKAETGSGNIELRDVDGALRAHTGSGNIQAAGRPAGPWNIETGSGSVEIWTGNAAFTLAAECGSGNIETDRAIVSQSASGHHRLAGTFNGGGPLVRIGTGSGSIGIH